LTSSTGLVELVAGLIVARSQPDRCQVAARLGAAAPKGRAGQACEVVLQRLLQDRRQLGAIQTNAILRFVPNRRKNLFPENTAGTPWEHVNI
jgi:hypothetical protein